MEKMHALARLTALAAALLAALAGAREPVELHPCSPLGRLGTMDESGIVRRPNTAREIAAGMARSCDYVVLGRFARVSDDHYDELLGPPGQPVVSTFQVSETLRGKAVAVAAIHLQRDMLAVLAKGGDGSRYLGTLEAQADEMYRHKLAAEVERELKSILDSAQPLTGSQHEHLLDMVQKLLQVPPRTKYERHQLVNRWSARVSPLSFHSELGAIRTNEVYLLGLDDANPTGSLLGNHFNALHTYLFWGREAEDIAAALR